MKGNLGKLYIYMFEDCESYCLLCILGLFVCMFERWVVSFVFVLSGGSISVYLKIWNFYPQ